ncbi:hypothetical protein CVO74_00965 [Xanthomonas prunicola]|uniref:Uncharacterized protein n=1 Tax=Xanthomonas prunicola TaxID=2053930 RepID=A0A2N3RQP3_9XANT|nr:hypothetical protein XpruCFBP8353_05490 [Xanthomonas prunicola]PKV19048.1 hypothetical protein XpruCFBP8354_05490 [Xanthomonas prunicola]PKV23183.1 hypothetical protein CVO74_00965 [Xanthomonas prunicola]
MHTRKRAEPALDQRGPCLRTGLVAAANLALLGVSAFSRRQPVTTMTLGTSAIERFHAYFAHSHHGGLDLGESAAPFTDRDSSMQFPMWCVSVFPAAVTILN